ncbi:MAG: heparinase II/III family protein [Alphaproteobacteria bacterium]
MTEAAPATPQHPPIGWYLAVARRPFARNARVIGYALRSLYYATPVHGLLLGGAAGRALKGVPIDPWPGDAGRGRAIIGGIFAFHGRTIRVTPPTQGAGPGMALWAPSAAGLDWLTALHGFAWLRDLRVAGGEAARETARRLVADWIARHKKWRRMPWRPDVLATRIAAWIASADVILPGAEPAFEHAFRASLARQARHLLRGGGGGLSGARLLTVLKGQVFAAAVVFGGGRHLRRTMVRLERELARQVLHDGGHIERSPAQQFAVLRDLVDIRSVLMTGGHPIPQALQNAIDRMAPMLRFFRHGDGGLALFNDSGEGEAWLVDMVLTRAEAPGKPLTSAPHSGFERVTANRTLLIADMGAPPPPGARDHTFAGTLSFELSVGKERLVVNCGGGPGLNATWRQAVRASAAHSTLTLADTNSTEILEAPGRGSEIGKHPIKVSHTRAESDGAIWLDGSHDGYVGGFGLIHRRRLWMASSGDEVRGEDHLIPPPRDGAADVPAGNDGADGTRRPWRWRRGRPRSFAVRFHLHPGVTASLLGEEHAVLLRLPSGVGWRFRAEGGNVSIENSIYVGGGEMRRANQIVVTGGVTAEGPRPGATVQWAFTRVKDK